MLRIIIIIKMHALQWGWVTSSQSEQNVAKILGNVQILPWFLVQKAA